MLDRGIVPLGNRAVARRKLEQGKVVMVLARAQEDHMMVDPVGHFEPDDPGIEGKAAVDVAHLEHEMAEPRRARAIGSGIGHG